jgi:hypothetical protein
MHALKPPFAAAVGYKEHSRLCPNLGLSMAEQMKGSLMQGRRFISLGATLLPALLLSVAEARGLVDQGPSDLAGIESINDPELPASPDVSVWVSMRGPFAKSVVADLKAAAGHQAMTCQDLDRGGLYLTCQFDGKLYNAIEVMDEGGPSVAD